jgi:hypothetical protein
LARKTIAHWTMMMLQLLRVILASGLIAMHAMAQCPDGGHSAQDRCWYLGEIGKSCAATCSAKGLTYSFAVPNAENPMVPKLLGRSPSNKQFSWSRTECYVPQGDRYHTAKPVADSNAGDKADPGAWAVEVCRLSCPCSGSQKAVEEASKLNAMPYPGCIAPNQVLRHAGAHAIFVDGSGFGSAGCWQNDCKNTDKFNAEDKGICARLCSQLDECTHWSFGEQEGATKCFFRKSDAGRESADGWHSAAKGCAPAALSDANLAKSASEALRACDGGKGDACPDMARAITTWKFAIKHLKKAADGKVDANTIQYITQIGSDTDAFSAQMSEENFPVIASNNRQVFNVMQSWMDQQPVIRTDPNDASLPNPALGKLCGPNSCYERV